ncbi:hypothetical protein L226DRAFT_571596 [Lentinus tigrinus ALCF2SS1-7]|uniref:RRM domain-containing protein n=1 Tax=Lentinus tigrinus ALCF2SS1-6 TaxID=1328759 RepID=A0A5C2RTF6_9APHY|nr:hypothetical protein L227DRAFT_615778 [Lentinus tigrinus ALCF2SS1-6]RPD74132.1 hypothetical protein L226DRAFT_571596 [Lentinus tigrinus ALCF2SS1-7]
MTTVHTSGSYTEPIVVSDEEDAAFVENELSRWTDSSNSSSNTPTYNPYTSYFTPVESPSSPTLPKAAPAPEPAPEPTPAPAPAPTFTPVEPPVSGQKRKWTDMRESGSAQALQHPENHGGSKKKKKQKKEKQRAAASSSHKPQRNARAPPPVDGANPMDYSGYPFMQPSFDAYYSYGMGYQVSMDSYQSAGTSFLSPEDEYRPTDGLLWNPSERPSTLSALAPPWYPPDTSYSRYESHPEPSSVAHPELRPPTPPPDPPPQASASTRSSRAEQPTTSSSAPPPLDLDSILKQPFDSSLSERLKQLEAISASLLALTNGQRSSQPASSTSPVDPIHLPPADPPPIHREPPPHIHREPPPPIHREPPPPRNVPEVPLARPQAESQKRLIGMTEDKGNSGYFDLTVPSLEPPAPAAPIPPVATFTLVMAHLPKKFRKTDFVMSWAKRHGTPVRVVLDMKNGKALIEWVGAHSVESAFTSMRLRGDGKEHIRVYHYRGDKPSPVPPLSSQGAAKVEKEMEEGEIEEGEVVEVGSKPKKKKNKGKKKAVELERRLTEPAAPTVIPPAEARPPPPHFAGLGDIDLAAVLSAVSRVPAISNPTPPEPRPQLIDRFTDPPAVVATRREAEEEEMELESDSESEKPSPLSAVPPPVVTVPSNESSDYQEEDMDLDEDDVGATDADVEEGEEEDMDMDMSSPSPSPTSSALPAPPQPPVSIRKPSPSPPPCTSDLPPHEATVEVAAAPLDPVAQTPDEDEIATAKEARRHKLAEAIARTKAELAMRALATSSRTSLVSSTGSSESPEPMTPADSPMVGHVEVAFASLAPHNAVDVIARKDPVVEEEKTAVVVKTEAVALDDLATSFISETLHAAAALPPVPSPVLPTAAPSIGVATASTRPLSVSIPAPKPTAPVMIPLSEEQKQVKQKKWFELVTTSKSLFAKIAAAKSKEERDLLMRLLRAKTKAADELKREIDSGVVLIAAASAAAATSTTSSVSPVSPMSTTASATPTPVPSSRMSSATPTPTPTGTPTPSMVPQKRKTSPPSGVPTPSLAFRWPETAREMIIIVSDDEESDYDY